MQFDNVIVRTVPLPLSIKGLTMPSNDDYYNVYINANYSFDMMKKTLEHELRHVVHYDFDSIEDIVTIERRADCV